MMDFLSLVGMNGSVMWSPRTWFDSLWKAIHAPKVDDRRLEECLHRVRRGLPTPVFWLLGKTQSGKTSVIRAMTGSSRVEIGSGFRPCTRTSQSYPFPDEENCFLRFLDTRGLGEVSYDPAEDLKAFEGQSHCLIVVMKAMDHAQESVLEPLRTIRSAHPEWPLVVVQTSLHEGYPTSSPCHPQPYPFDQDPLPPEAPQDLVRSMARQRQLFEGSKAHFVPVDFTMPEDGFEPEHYGLEALWSAIEEAVPSGLRGMLQQTASAREPLRDVYFHTAHPHIVWYSVAAAGAAGVPVPLVDIPLCVAIQAKLFHTLASIYGQQINAQRMAEVFSTLGVGIVARLGGREVFKLIPGIGSTVAALFAGASTYALGCTLAAYFSYIRGGDVPDPAMLRQLYQEQFQEGRKRLREYLGRVSPSRKSSS